MPHSSKSTPRRSASNKAKGLTPSHRTRHDGWTQERQVRFLAAVAHTGCVTDACRIVGVSRGSAYRLRGLHPDFADAWEKALLLAGQGLEAIAYKRAVEGSETIIMRNGVEVERRISPSDSLLALLIKRGRLNAGAFLPDDEVITRAEHNDGWRFDEKTGAKYQNAFDYNGQDARGYLLDKILEYKERKAQREAQERAAAANWQYDANANPNPNPYLEP
jgi:hypothetical protein